MPLINFYANDEDYIKFKQLEKSQKEKIKEKIRQYFRKIMKRRLGNISGRL